MKLLRSAPVTPPPLEKQVLLAAEAMVRYALASGVRVPAWVVDTVRRAETTYRHTPEEVTNYCDRAGLEIEHTNLQEAGITVVARKH